jgi:hypothetical protein
MSKLIKAAAATGALLMGLIVHSGASQAQRWDGWRGFGWGGGGFRGAVLPGVGWAGRWGGQGGWGRPVGPALGLELLPHRPSRLLAGYG